jgi:hypothetical protein
MKHSSLWVVTFASLAVGTLMIFGGAAAGSDIGSLAAGYGLLVIASSLFLGFGLAIQALVLKGSRTRRDVRAPVGTALEHRF